MEVMLFPREEHRRNGKVDLFPRREHLISRHPGRVRSAIARFHGDPEAIGAGALPCHTELKE